MCAPIGDGAAAAVLCAKSKVARYTTKPVWVPGRERQLHRHRKRAGYRG